MLFLRVLPATIRTDQSEPTVSKVPNISAASVTKVGYYCKVDRRMTEPRPFDCNVVPYILSYTDVNRMCVYGVLEQRYPWVGSSRAGSDKDLCKLLWVGWGRIENSRKGAVTSLVLKTQEVCHTCESRLKGSRYRYNALYHKTERCLLVS